MRRVVLDTNIIISSVLGGALVLVLEKWGELLREKWILLSAEIVTCLT